MDGVLEEDFVSDSEAADVSTDDLNIEHLESIEASDQGAAFLVVVEDENRFKQWLVALKLRYWVDFGNQEDYNVDWLKKTGPGGELVELLVKLYACNESGDDGKRLFTLTVYLTKRKIMVQGKQRALWKDIEFTKLRYLVTELCGNNALTREDISSLYAKAFQDQETGDGNAKLNLTDVCLNITHDSDSEGYIKEEIAVSSPKRSTRRKLLKSATKSVFRSASKVRGKSASAGLRSGPSHLLVMLDNVCKRVDKLEVLVTKMDKAAVESDLGVTILSKELAETKTDISESLISRLKHELCVMRETHDRMREELEARIANVESESKKWQGRVGSLVEEKNQMMKRVKSVEVTNNELCDQVAALTSVNKSLVEENSLTSDEFVATEPSSSAPLSESRQEPPVEPDRDGIETSGERDTREENTTRENAPDAREIFDFVFLCDSNRKHIKLSELCPTGKSKIITCNTTDKAIDILGSPKFDVRRGLLINTGVNDLEHLPVEEIIRKQIQMVDLARQAFPDRKVIVSSITPRCDNLDGLVRNVNYAVGQRIQGLSNVILVDNGNLRRRHKHNYCDAKHLSDQDGVRVFAGNIKAGIRRALGISTRPRQARRGNRSSSCLEAQDVDWDRLPTDVLRGEPPSPLPTQHCAPRHTTTPDGPAIFNQLVDLTNMMKQLVTNQCQGQFYPPMPPVPPGLGFCRPPFCIPPQLGRMAAV